MRLRLCSFLLPAVLAASPLWAVDTGPTATDLLNDARAALQAGDYPAALDLLTDADARQPGNADVLNLLGYTSRKLGDLPAAGRHYAAALTIAPDHLGALEYQGELFILLDDRAGAEANLARLTALCGTCPEAMALSVALTGAPLDGPVFDGSGP